METILRAEWATLCKWSFTLLYFTLLKYVGLCNIIRIRFDRSRDVYRGVRGTEKDGGLREAQNGIILEIIGNPSEYRKDTCTGVTK